MLRGGGHGTARPTSVNSCGLCVGRKLAAVFLARVIAGGFLCEVPARVLPSLPFVVPMETELREDSGDFAGLLLLELYPDPFADNFGHLPKGRCLALEDLQNFVGR